jgi:hypothetical protein
MREIEVSWIERVIRSPLWTEPEPTDTTIERRFASIVEKGDRVLRVVVREDGTHISVVSMTWDSGARRRLRQGKRP